MASSQAMQFRNFRRPSGIWCLFVAALSITPFRSPFLEAQPGPGSTSLSGAILSIESGNRVTILADDGRVYTIDTQRNLPALSVRDRLTVSGISKQGSIIQASAVSPAKDALGRGIQLPPLVKNISISKAEACRGEEVAVSVTTESWGKSGANTPSVVIDGYPGSVHFLHFSGQPGPRLLHVAVTAYGRYIESSTRRITIADCPAVPFLAVHTRFNPYHPYTVDFMITNPDITSRQSAFVWDFGDGQSQRTVSPYVSHYYGDSIDGTTPYKTFITSASGPDGTALTRYAVTLHINYFYNKRKGFIQPITNTNRVLEHRDQVLSGSYSIRNLEPGPLTIDSAFAEYQHCDLDKQSLYEPADPSRILQFPSGATGGVPETRPGLPAPLSSATTPPTSRPSITGDASVASAVGTARPLTIVSSSSISSPIVVAASSTYTGHVDISSSIPVDFCGIGLHLIGHTQKSEPVYASLYYPLRVSPTLTHTVDDEQLRRFLIRLANLKLVPEGVGITQEDLYRLQQQGRIVRTAVGWEVRY